MKSKSFFLIIFFILATVIGVGINSTFNLIAFFGSEHKDTPPVFRHQLSVQRADKYEACKQNFSLPENAFWYEESSCKWECLSDYKKNRTSTACIELTQKEKDELLEIQAALDAQNGVGPEEEADPTPLKEGVTLNGLRYYPSDINNSCYLSLPSTDKLSGYNLPLKMTCDGKETNLFNIDCIGKQFPVEEGVLLRGDIQCINEDLSRFFNWCQYEFKEEGLLGYLKCPVIDDSSTH